MVNRHNVQRHRCRCRRSRCEAVSSLVFRNGLIRPRKERTAKVPQSSPSLAVALKRVGYTK